MEPDGAYQVGTVRTSISSSINGSANFSVQAPAPGVQATHQNQMVHTLLRLQNAQQHSLFGGIPTVAPTVATVAPLAPAEPPKATAGDGGGGAVGQDFVDLVLEQRARFEQFRAVTTSAIQAGRGLDESALRILHDQYASQMQQIQAMANMLSSAYQMKGLAQAAAAGGALVPSASPNLFASGLGVEAHAVPNAAYLSAMVQRQQLQHHRHQLASANLAALVGAQTEAPLELDTAMAAGRRPTKTKLKRSTSSGGGKRKVPKTSKGSTPGAPNRPKQAHATKGGTQHFRPRESYAELAFHAISAQESQKASVRQIYDYVTDRFPFYKQQGAVWWQNCIRHNLSTKPMFVRHEDGGGGGIHLWSIKSGYGAESAAPSPPQCSHPRAGKKDQRREEEEAAAAAPATAATGGGGGGGSSRLEKFVAHPA